jgi:hypothetical protein
VKSFVELGLGNRRLLETELESRDGEMRVPGAVVLPRIRSIYLRVWLGRRVLILDTDRGIRTMRKDRRALKVLAGLRSDDQPPRMVRRGLLLSLAVSLIVLVAGRV